MVRLVRYGICVAIAVFPFAMTLSADLEDSFESADMSATNAQGFSWGSNNKTSVVTEDAVVYSNGPVNIPRPDGRDWTPYDGEHSLRFRYPGGASGSDAFAEQRFNLGTDYPEFWASFKIRVPINFNHRSDNPGNNKFFEIWTDGKETQGTGGTVTWNFLRDSADGGSVLVFSTNNGSKGTGLGNSTKFVSLPADRGRWMHVVIQIRLASSAGSNDGEVRLWRRWVDQANHELIQEATNRDIPRDASGRGLQDGYLMGWSNSGYDENTEWLVDKFKVSSASLLDAGGQDKARPNPPDDVTVD